MNVLSLQAQRELLENFPQKTTTDAILPMARNKVNFITNCTYPMRIYIIYLFICGLLSGAQTI
jgi:hypothetical protein